MFVNLHVCVPKPVRIPSCHCAVLLHNFSYLLTLSGSYHIHTHSHRTQRRGASGWWRGGHDQGCFRLDRKLPGCEVCLWVSACVKQEAGGLWGLRHVCVRSWRRSGPDGRHPRWVYVWVLPGQGSNWAWSQCSAGCPSARRKTIDLLLSVPLSYISISFPASFCFFYIDQSETTLHRISPPATNLHV